MFGKLRRYKNNGLANTDLCIQVFGGHCNYKSNGFVASYFSRALKVLDNPEWHFDFVPFL